ncbi:MAG: hypothetical protein ACRDJW_23715 [Thermomicrobiales bacterium]
MVGHLFRRVQSQSRLAHAARSGDCEKADIVAPREIADSSGLPLPADQRRQRRRQVKHLFTPVKGDQQLDTS